jgi:hypothetical protein
MSFHVVTLSDLARGVWIIRAGFVDRDVAVTQGETVQSIQGGLGLGWGGHGDVGKTAGAASDPVEHELDFADLTFSGEQFEQHALGNARRKVSDVKFSIHKAPNEPAIFPALLRKRWEKQSPRTPENPKTREDQIMC